MTRIRMYIVLVCVVGCLLGLKDAQPAAASPENSDLEVVACIKSECLMGAPQPPIDWSFLEEDDVNSKELQVMIAPDTSMLIELLTDLRAVDLRQDTDIVANYYRELIGRNPKRLHDIAMLLLKKLCETDYADADPEGAFQLMQCSETFIPIIEANLQRDYVALFQAYMFTAVIHNLGDVWFAMCCRKAFNLAEAHEDFERKDLVTQFVIQTQHLCRNVGKIERSLRQNAIQSQDHRFLDHILSAFAPPPPPPPAKDNDANHTTSSKGAVAASPPTYEEAKKALGL